MNILISTWYSHRWALHNSRYNQPAWRGAKTITSFMNDIEILVNGANQWTSRIGAVVRHRHDKTWMDAGTAIDTRCGIGAPVT